MDDSLKALLDQMDKRIGADNRLIGQVTMQNLVLRWAVEHRAHLPALLRDSLMRTMQGSIDAAMLERRPLTQPIMEGTCSAE